MNMSRHKSCTVAIGLVVGVWMGVQSSLLSAAILMSPASPKKGDTVTWTVDTPQPPGSKYYWVIAVVVNGFHRYIIWTRNDRTLDQFPCKPYSDPIDLTSVSLNFGDVFTTRECQSVAVTYPLTVFVELWGYTPQGVLFNYGQMHPIVQPAIQNQNPVANAGPDQTVFAGESVSFNGSASSDPDGTIQSYDWSFGDGTPNQSGVTVSHTYSSAGQYSVTLTVTDNAGATASDSLIVTVQTPQQAAQSLIGDVANLVSSNVLNNGQGNALTSKLDAAISKLNDGNANAAENQLNAFINQVNAMVNSGTLTAAQGEALISSANTIIAHL